MSDRPLRADNRRNHRDDETRLRSGPVRTLTPEEIAAMDPNKPTEPKRILVDQLPTVPDTIDQSLAKVQEAVQSTLSALHRRATKDLQLLDEKQLQSLSTIATILLRIKKLDPGDLPEPGDMTPDQITAELKARRG